MERFSLVDCLDYITALDHLEWDRRTKTEYYLAQIAAEIRRLRESFMKNPQQVTIQECLLDFTTKTEADAVEEAKEYKPGPDLVKDPKWAAINANAKMVWGQRLRRNIGKIDAPKVKEEEGRKPGPDLVKDINWARVNRNAKMVWASRLRGIRRAKRNVDPSSGA